VAEWLARPAGSALDTHQARLARLLDADQLEPALLIRWRLCSPRERGRAGVPAVEIEAGTWWVLTGDYAHSHAQRRSRRSTAVEGA